MKINLRLDRERASKILRISIKHAAVSVVCGTVEYMLFLLLYVKLDCLLFYSYVAAYLVATTMGYLLHNYFTFNLRLITKSSTLLYIIQSFLILTVGYIIITLFLWMSITPQVAKPLQLFATFGLNMAFGRYLTFNKNVWKK
jgi:putative flippase GtrA